MKPLPLAILVILVWTILVIVDNWPRKDERPQIREDDPMVVSSNPPPLQMVEQPRYRLGQ